MATISPTASVDGTLSGLLETIATRFASRPALLHRPSLKTEVWTYRDLYNQADRVTRWLQDQGVGKGDRVVLWAPNSPWWVAAFFGILRNGSVMVPLDVRSSPDFVDRVFGQSEPRLAIAAAAKAHDWKFDLPVFALEQLDGILPPRGTAARHVDIEPDDLAEIVFTSGTTGTPKGVMLSHGNIRANVEAAFTVFPSGPKLEPLSILPLSHLLEQTVGLLLPLRGGARIAYATALQPAAIQRDMAEYRVTTMILVPFILSMFMDAIERSVKHAGREPTWKLMCRIAEYLPMPARRLLFRRVIQSFGGRLEFLVAGGAPLDPELEHKWELMGIPIMQGYGASETAPIITVSTLHDSVPGSVGKAIPGLELRLAPDGEIKVKGPNVMQGYWKNPQATAEALVDGFYNTGDLGELDAAGHLFIKGRKKNMIVLENGMKVFPEDLEEVLGRIPGVIEAVVMVVPSDYGPQIHAVLLTRSKDVDGAAIVQQANAHLAHHQQIRSFEIWPQPDFPRTHTAKIKRPEVAAYVLAERKGQQRPAQPQATLLTSRKPSVVEILAGVLGKPAAELTPETRLTDLGVDVAVRVALGRAIEDRLGKFLDDPKISPDTTVGDLDVLLTTENQEHLYPLWPFSPGIRFARSLLQKPIFGAINSFNGPHVLGREYLEGLSLPAIFVMEYRNYLDAPFVLDVLPDRIRQRVGISTAWKRDRKTRLVGTTLALCFNSFRYNPAGPLHTALVHASGLLDHCWSILFLLRDPATHCGLTGNMDEAIGLLTAEFSVPVVPVRVTGLDHHIPLLPIPRPGVVTIQLGEPIICKPGMTYRDVTAELRAAMRAPDSEALPRVAVGEADTHTAAPVGDARGGSTAPEEQSVTDAVQGPNEAVAGHTAGKETRR